MSPLRQRAEVFDCEGQSLLGILQPVAANRGVGVVLLVGGPQYRVGAHRMYVEIARCLSRIGIPSFRFDYRGMGDSYGEAAEFSALDADVSAAITHFMSCVDGISSVVLLGLCDGASAAAIYSHADQRVSAKVLINPWVHSEQGEARAYLSYYYPRRLVQWSFWRSLLTGQLDMLSSIQDLLRKIRAGASTEGDEQGNRPAGFRDKMLDGLTRFDGEILVLLSEHDLTATEFRDVLNTDSSWAALARRFAIVELPGADHTLSERQSLRQFFSTIEKWFGSISNYS